MKLSALFIATVAAEKVNWWSSFDKKGWSTCNKGSNGYMYMNGLYRNNCHKLYCIEEVDCRGDGGDSCYDANWWSSFDKRGWSTCADGSYMSGLYRNTRDPITGTGNEMDHVDRESARGKVRELSSKKKKDGDSSGGESEVFEIIVVHS